MNRCLVVDNSRVMRKVSCAILETLDFDTAEADDADTALAYCREGMPKLILLELDPRIGALVFLRNLRREAGGNEPFVVFSTIENDVDRISEALAAGANDYLMKPFDREMLQSKLVAAGLI